MKNAEESILTDDVCTFRIHASLRWPLNAIERGIKKKKKSETHLYMDSDINPRHPTRPYKPIMFSFRIPPLGFLRFFRYNVHIYSLLADVDRVCSHLKCFYQNPSFRIFVRIYVFCLSSTFQVREV